MKTIIHLGANKTGSTTLQRCLFAKSDELLYLGEDCPEYDAYKHSLNSLVSDDDLFFDFQAAQRIFTKVLGRDPGKTALYSNEDIMASRVPSQCAQRLKRLLPNAEILVILRNQLTAIPSWYANHGAFLKGVPRCHWQRYVSFDSWLAYCLEFINYSPLASFFYHRILGLYASLYGKDSIHILFYEDFVNSKPTFVKDLCKVLCIDPSNALALLGDQRERPRNSGRLIKYNAFRNWFFWNQSLSKYLPAGAILKRWLLHYLEKGAPARIDLSESWKRELTDLYQQDNTKLAQAFDLPLRRYGYPLAQQ